MPGRRPLGGIRGGCGSAFRGLLSPRALSSRAAGPPTSGGLDVNEHTDGSNGTQARALGRKGDRGLWKGRRRQQWARVWRGLWVCPPTTPPPPAISAGNRALPRTTCHPGGGSPVPQQRPSALTTLQMTLTRLGEDLACRTRAAAHESASLTTRADQRLRSLGPALGPVPKSPVAPCSHSTGSTCACNSLPTGEVAAAAAAAPEMTNNSSMGRPLPSAQRCSSCPRRRNQIRKINRAVRIFP